MTNTCHNDHLLSVHSK